MNQSKVDAVPGAGRFGARAVSAAALLAAVAVAAGCAAPPEQEALAESGTEPTATDFAFVEGFEPAGIPAGSHPEETSTLFSAAEAPAQLLAARERFPEKLPDGIPWATDPYSREPEKDAVIEEGVFDNLVAGYGDWDSLVQIRGFAEIHRADPGLKSLKSAVLVPLSALRII